MFSSPRRIGPAIRLAMARRPWIRWLAIGITAFVAGWLILGQLRQVEDARRSWTEQRTVFVAAHEHLPGDRLEFEERRLPTVAIPESALTDAPTGVVARQRIAHEEVLTSLDVGGGRGPATSADDGDVVVAVSDPLLVGAMTAVSSGLEVAVHSDGSVLAERAHIVAVEGDVVFVALDPIDAPGVSAAAQLRSASLAFLR